MGPGNLTIATPMVGFVSLQLELYNLIEEAHIEVASSRFEAA
jgi:hypothetical protein